MRRKDKEISDQSGIKAIINAATVCRLGMVHENKPYIVPLCFGQYSDQQFQFPENKIEATAVIKVEIESMTGKQSGF
jgi:hypothetical protein